MQQQILAAATRLFAARGFEGTPLSAIAAEVGVAKPSLLYHYPSKDALREAVLGNLLAHWSEVLPELLMAATTGGQRFHALVEAIVAFFTEDPNRARLLLREMLDRPDALRKLFAEHVSPWLGVLAEYIRLGQREGRIWAGLDPEAYLLNIIHQIVSGIAVSEVFTELYPASSSADDDANDAANSRRELQTRHIEEMVRMAHSSLFLPRALPDRKN